MNQRAGILLIDKPTGVTSFKVVSKVRHLLSVQKVGHGGTLDPLATGVLVVFVGREYTRLAENFLNSDKEYRATVQLGIATDSGDSDGIPIATSETIATLEEIEDAVASFQGDQEQCPPMFSAKKHRGKKLYELARQGIEVERQPVQIHMTIAILDYTPPLLKLHIACSKGTYIRTLAHDLGVALGCYGHLTALQRCRSGNFPLEHCLAGSRLFDGSLSPEEAFSHLIQI